MGVLSSIELPHWLMIGGAILIAMGFLGLAFTRNKKVATNNPDSEPPAPRSKMPPLPRLLDSSNRKETNDGGRPSGASSSSEARSGPG
jgi:hypothetical protein